MPHSSDPIQEAGIPSLLFVLILLVFGVGVAILLIAWLVKPLPPFTEEQEKRIAEIIEQKLKETKA